MTAAAPTPAIIELAGVEKTYRMKAGRGGGQGVGFRALNGVDLVIATGEMVAITGPSGSGKTTIINLIAGIDQPTAGTVTVNGSRLDQMSEEQLAVWRGHTIGIVFQFFQLMPTLTAVENATLPLDLARSRAGPRAQGHGEPQPRHGRARRSAATGCHWSCPAGSSNASRSPGRWPARRRSCSATSQPATSTPSWPWTCSACSRSLNGNGTTVVYVTHDQALAGLASRIVSVRDGLIVDDTGRRP